MADGIPLNDADRWDWLETLREEALCSLMPGSPHVIISCSALKRKNRDVIRTAAYYWTNVRVHFVYLHVDTDIVRRRLMARYNHFMGAGMVGSQLKALEVPRVDERDIYSIDASTSIEDVVAVVRRALNIASPGCNNPDYLTDPEIFGAWAYRKSKNSCLELSIDEPHLRFQYIDQHHFVWLRGQLRHLRT